MFKSKKAKKADRTIRRLPLQFIRGQYIWTQVLREEDKALYSGAEAEGLWEGKAAKYEVIRIRVRESEYIRGGRLLAKREIYPQAKSSTAKNLWSTDNYDEAIAYYKQLKK